MEEVMHHDEYHPYHEHHVSVNQLTDFSSKIAVMRLTGFKMLVANQF